MHDFFSYPVLLLMELECDVCNWSSTLDSETSAMCGRWRNKTE